MLFKRLKHSIEFGRRIIHFGSMIKRFKSGRLPTPSVIQIQTISTCNGKCPFCPYPYTSKTLPQGKMEWDIYQSIIDQASKFPTLQILTLMLQNEPLMDKHIFRAIEYAKSKLNKCVSVNLVSNGYIMNDEVVTHLIDSRLDHLVISLNAYYKETYEALMPGFKHDVILNNIERLLAHNNHSMQISIRFLETNHNHIEIRKAVSYWKRRRVRTEIFSFLTNRANTVDISHFRPVQHGRPLLNSLKRRFISFFNECCNFPFFQMNILFNGDVLICCNDWGREPVMGNVRDHSLTDIWFSDAFNQIRTNVINNTYQAIAACRNCSTPEIFS